MPWEDLRYLFGEIMYGGHITDDWDRKLCKTFLEEYMAPEMVGLLNKLILSLHGTGDGTFTQQACLILSLHGTRDGTFTQQAYTVSVM